ncbi:MAG: hypothetical protein ABGZ17_06530 [Planctomycetaceae bacterium]
MTTIVRVNMSNAISDLEIQFLFEGNKGSSIAQPDTDKLAWQWMVVVYIVCPHLAYMIGKQGDEELFWLAATPIAIL